VPLTDGSGTVPVQFQYSDAVHGPEGPRRTPAPSPGIQPQKLRTRAGNDSTPDMFGHLSGRKKT